MKKRLIQLGSCILFLLILDIIGIKVQFVSYCIGILSLAIVVMVGEMLDKEDTKE